LILEFMDGLTEHLYFFGQLFTGAWQLRHS
jgi:hypothetical protein